MVCETQSLCPVCLGRIDAAYTERDGAIWLQKTCAEHGFFEAQVWAGDAASFAAWQRQSPAQPPAAPAMAPNRGCPYDCGLCENHAQASCCILLELTARCNLGCPVCFAAAGPGAAGGDEADDPPMEQISGWYDMLMAHGGPFNIQLSGGEPTLRDDLPAIIRLGREKGFTFFQLNTNGLRLAADAAYAQNIAAAGLNTVFLQFDSLNDQSNRALRGRPLLAEKKRAIRHCAAAGLGVVLVPTVAKGVNDGELGTILDFAAQSMPAVRGVHFQPMSFFGRYQAPPAPDAHVTVPALLAALERQTSGRVKASHFTAGGAEHPMCTFHADYAVDGPLWLAQKQPAAGCCCAPKAPHIPTSNLARDAVARKWSAPALEPAISWDGGDSYKLDALDSFLQQKATQSLAISGMAFQDVWTVDLNRLKRCHVHVVSSQNTLVPFCAWNLTSQSGSPLYRGKKP